ncbi:hypothetical protein BUALT_Bualt12G0046600 [Buddleja alternifolia]|uniref:Uncharacterized protein n=1 Tax=Buddleja alternifolia TaxID=168488 RepID=A0AAV6WVD0_9LAMI|nr:hypothetical protein BUALT_Bualt12G0046600 [Buddleja alternifolia]
MQAPFLSLNLNAISEQLSKAKLSKRLFIEPDLLPPELLDDELQSYAEDKGEPKACTSAVEIDSGPSHLGYNQEKSKILQQYHKPISSAQGVNPIEEIKDEIVLQSQQTDRIPSANLTSVEAELDMLLNSFAETNIVDSSPVKLPSIDNLLEQTSDLTKMDRRGLSHGSVNTSTDDISSKSKLLEDFDSWLDTI